MGDVLFASITSALIVFISRIFDRAGVVIELNFLAKNKKLKLFIAAFIETIIWCLFSAHVLKSGDMYQIGAYILGFAVGNTVGVILLEYLSNDVLSVRIYVPKTYTFLMKKINDEGFGCTALKVGGKDSNDNLMIIVNLPKKKYKKLERIIKDYVPNAFVTVYDTKSSVNGVI